MHEFKEGGRQPEDGEGDAVSYLWSDDEWEVCKEKLKENGKWYLD